MTTYGNGNPLYFDVPKYTWEDKPYHSLNAFQIAKAAVFMLMVTPNGDVVMVTGEMQGAEISSQDYYTQKWVSEYSPYYPSKHDILSKPTPMSSYQFVVKGVQPLKDTKTHGAILHIHQKINKYSKPNPAYGLAEVLIDKVKAKMPQHLYSSPEVNEAIQSAVLEMFGL